MKTLLVTGGAGFIGSQFLRTATDSGYRVVCLDKLTYAGSRANLPTTDNCLFVEGDIKNRSLVQSLLREHQPIGIVHFAAESHVDNSIAGPQVFIETNVLGTFQLLEASREYVANNKDFRFLHVSTDEVFGELGATGFFSETTPYQPNSPYSASKAASDHLVRAWHHTYGLNTVTTNCSNNYGPRQFPEKLIPKLLFCALEGKPLPVYGEGQNIRDWIHVEDHCRGVLLAFEKGESGGTYCFGGRSERKNIDVVKALCNLLNETKPRTDSKGYEQQITFVTDRLGHDFRYAIDDSLAESELGFKRKFSEFEQGLRATVDWYLSHGEWLQKVQKEKS